MSYAAWTAFIERHHRHIVAASALLGVLCALALTRLRLDIDVLGMLPHGTPAFDDFKSFVADFGELNQLVVVIEGGELPQLQRFADELATRLAQLDTVARVQARIDTQQILAGPFGRYLSNYIPEAAYDEVARGLTPQRIDAQVEAMRAILSAPFDLSAAQAMVQDPLGLRRFAAAALLDSYASTPSLSGGYLVSTDGRALLLLVRPMASAFDIAFSERLLTGVRAAAEEARRTVNTPSIGVRYTGSYIFALEDAATLKWDVGRYTVLALLGVLAVFYFGYRNLRILPFVTYPLLLTTLVAFALSLLLFEQLNAVSISFAAILYGLSIDSAVYFFTRLLEEQRRTADLRAAVRSTMAGLGRPEVAAAATTAGAFLAIGASALTGVSQLGVLTALGMLVTIVFFFLLYPALTFALAERISSSPAPMETPRLERWARACSTHPRAVTAGAIAAAVLLLLAARHVQLDVALTHLRPGDSEAARVQDEVTSRFGITDTSGAVVIRRADLDQALAESEAIAQRLRLYKADGAVSIVRSVEGALPSAPAQRARLRRFNQLPRAEAADVLRQALARRGFVPEKFAAFLDAFAAPRNETTDLIRDGDAALAPLAPLIEHHVQKRGDEYLVATYVQPAAGVRLAAVADRLRRDLPDTHFAVAARPLLEDELGVVLRRELRWFCVLGVGGNLLLLLLIFRHLGTAVAILAPVLLVVIGLFAGMAAAGVALDPVNLIVTPLVFGIGVDYGVYVAARARECGDVPRALRLSGRAVAVAGLTTITGFGFLAFSRYPFLATMGLLAGLGLLLCLVFTVVLLPPFLAVLGPAPRAQSTP